MARHIFERVIDHSGREKYSHILKHQFEKEHSVPQYESFEIIVSGFHNKIKTRKLSEVID